MVNVRHIQLLLQYNGNNIAKALLDAVMELSGDFCRRNPYHERQIIQSIATETKILSLQCTEICS